MFVYALANWSYNLLDRRIGAQHFYFRHGRWRRGMSMGVIHDEVCDKAAEL